MKQFSESLEAIHASLLNLIDVADNLIPETLSRNGIKQCIIEYCGNFEADKNCKKTPIFIGNFVRLDETIEIKLYKIFNNIISFILTHSTPSEIILNITQSNEFIGFDIIDNGKEFDLSSITSSGITEIAKIKSLIETLEGSFTLGRTEDKWNKINMNIKI